jgi:hypothetical protein
MPPPERSQQNPPSLRVVGHLLESRRVVLEAGCSRHDHCQSLQMVCIRHKRWENAALASWPSGLLPTGAVRRGNGDSRRVGRVDLSETVLPEKLEGPPQSLP